MNGPQSVLKLKPGGIAYIPALGVSEINPNRDRNWILILTKGAKGMDFTRFATRADAIRMRNIVFDRRS